MIVEGLEPGRLLSLEFRRPLVEKRADPLAAIFRKIAANLLLDLVFEGLCKFFLLCSKESLFYGLDCQGRYLCDFLCQRLYLGLKLRTGNDIIDDAKAKRGSRVDHITGIKKLGRFGWSDKLRQEIRAAVIRKEAYLGEILPEGRFFRRNSDVGRQRNIHARTGGGSVHGRNHRLGHAAHLEDRLHSPAQQWLQLLRFTAPAALSDQRQVPTRAESAPGASDHNYTDALILRDTSQRFIKRRGQFVVQRIQPVGTIHHQRGDAFVLPLQEDRSGLRGLWRVAHGELRSVASGFVFFTDASNELRQLSKMPQLLAPARGIRAAGGGQNIHSRAVKQFFLNPKFAFSLGKLFVSEFSVESHDVR